MAKNGSGYQEQAAAFFRKLGLRAEVELRVEGARGAHDIDVWVTGTIQTFQVRWIVECKDWATNVPKEKVLALQAIAQDVGADRAFLLSEKGFQSGAIRCARNTNISLTSLADLEEQTREYLTQATLSALYFRAQRTTRKLIDLTQGVTRAWRDKNGGKAEGWVDSRSTTTVGDLTVLEHGIAEAMTSGFPVVYGLTENDDRITARSINELLSGAEAVLKSAEQIIASKEEQV
jgi:hypothetical protein